MLKVYLTSPPQFARFIMTGLIAVSTDFLFYNALVTVIPIDTAKGCSFIFGSIAAFFLNKLWTFNDQSTIGQAVIKYAGLYSATFLSNVAVNHFSLLLLPDMKFLCFLLATGTSTILNYIGLKYWVFSNSNKQGCL